MFILLFGLTNTGKTSTDSTGHTLFHGKIALDSLFLCIGFDGTKHRLWPAGIDHIGFDSLLTNSIQYISLCSRTAIFCCHIKSSRSTQLLCQEQFISVSCYCLHLRTTIRFQCLSQLYHRWHTDSSTHKKGLFPFQWKSISHRSNDLQLVSFCQM